MCTFPSHRDFDAALLVFIFLSSRFSYSEDFQIGQHIVVCAVKNKRASKCHPAFLPSQNDLLVKIKSREMNDIKSCQSVESNRWNSTRAVHSTRYVQFPAAIPFGEQDRKFGTWFLSFHIFKLKMWCLNLKKWQCSIDFSIVPYELVLLKFFWLPIECKEQAETNACRLINSFPRNSYTVKESI